MEHDAISCVVLVSAEAEWTAVCTLYAPPHVATSPFGEHFTTDVTVKGRQEQVIYFFGGWGKIAAAASAQYVIDSWHPRLLLNAGTCGSLDPSLQRGDVVLAAKTVVYDIVEQMGSAEEAIQAYTTRLDVTWAEALVMAGVLHSGTLVSADGDVSQDESENLRHTYGALAADWESGAIAWVAQRNSVPVAIIRGVSDSVTGSEALAYGGLAHFQEGSRLVMKKIAETLPDMLTAWEAHAARADQRLVPLSR